MKKSRLFILIVFTAFLGLAGFEVLAEPHDCATHCAAHTDAGAKMCKTHCATGAAENHDCATHCKEMPVNDADNACAIHCENSK